MDNLIQAGSYVLVAGAGVVVGGLVFFPLGLAYMAGHSHRAIHRLEALNRALIEKNKELTKETVEYRRVKTNAQALYKGGSALWHRLAQQVATK
jgi:hypothetical protein